MVKRAKVPAETVERRLLSRIIPYAQNPRTHSTEQVALLAKLMVEYGIDQPIVVDEDGVILKGHGRRLAALQAGFKHFPVVVQSGLSENDKRAIRIADNQVALLAGWDAALIKLEVGALQLAGFALPLLGFGDAELATFLDTTAGKTPAEATPDLPDVAVTRPGDLWHLGRHRLLCGDATNADDVGRLLAGKKPPLMVTDPPYGVDYDPQWRARLGVTLNRSKLGKVENDDRNDWREAWALFPGDVMYVWHAARHAAAVQASIESVGFDVVTQIIWAKDRFALSRGDYHWQHEPCWYAVRHGKNHRWAGDRSQTSVWPIPAREDKGHGHGTQKPIECMRRPVENNSKAGDLVYDPFLGSGTTLIVCEMNARKCVGTEIDPRYCDVIIERWQTFAGKSAMLDGQSFEAVKAARHGAKRKRKAAAETALPALSVSCI